MADKKVQIKFRNAQNEFDNIYPKTKDVAKFVGTTQPTDADIWFEIL